MIHKELEECKICGYKAKSNSGMTIHLKRKHNLTLK